MRNFENWTEITKGIYRYAISPGCAYEIYILYWDKSKDILNAKASAYIVGEWSYRDRNLNTLERELITTDTSVIECIKAAIADDEGNNE